MMNSKNQLNIDDPHFQITPIQQMAAACTGALITSFFGELIIHIFILKDIIININFKNL